MYQLYFREIGALGVPTVAIRSRSDTAEDPKNILRVAKARNLVLMPASEMKAKYIELIITID